ncbi:MAG: hypothetical protein JRH18_17305 [Deltaproteobacteria bacterium]|nr:hypothetical protein [Deltaproteobacteria bacterium]MBW1960420.1 hypothetical protein [Deltaproteobacteria bacterium]MBW1994162.1 hypothetical protein [Deltaproteobacteria bacterium]MBW2153414.1 hypothetical protein [Deltaproteobacteria bacterium]
MTKFKPQCRASLIGSMPLDDHDEALELVLSYVSEIPAWVQLPVHAQEQMMVQYLAGFPGLVEKQGQPPFIDTDGKAFEKDILSFYEEFIAVSEGQKPLDESRFVLTPATAQGFFVFMKKMISAPTPPLAVKGQITGPITLATAIKDHNQKAIFYNEQLRDAAVKLLAQKARWQVLQLQKISTNVNIFFDEPGLAGFGSSAFISISEKEVSACFAEVIESVQMIGALAGIHVCANTQWSLILESSVNIASFDAYSYFDKFALYPNHIKEFINRGGILSWGIVPTSNPDDIDRETASSLAARLQAQFSVLVELGVDKNLLFDQSMITPSCGMGSLSVPHAKKVLALTRDVSRTIRESFQ